MYVAAMDVDPRHNLLLMSGVSPEPNAAIQPRISIYDTNQSWANRWVICWEVMLYHAVRHTIRVLFLRFQAKPVMLYESRQSGLCTNHSVAVYYVIYI